LTPAIVLRFPSTMMPVELPSTLTRLMNALTEAEALGVITIPPLSGPVPLLPVMMLSEIYSCALVFGWK